MVHNEGSLMSMQDSFVRPDAHGRTIAHSEGDISTEDSFVRPDAHGRTIAHNEGDIYLNAGFVRQA